ncbi:MAG TPA: YCF48-related protein [Candidatus Sulfotelmatobacter sp.]|nr:YCF48-related protein [Candidatus Sulfotelmatobacter sp.]
MEKVPQIVAERLKAAPGGHHPDPDMLTAFSERSLSNAERTSVLDHLARCAECREIVALALPASETVQRAVRPGKSGWLTWPALRWGLIGAGIVAIASFGVVQYRHQHASTMMAYNAPRVDAVKKSENVTTSLSNAAQSPRDEDKAASSVPAESPSLAANTPNPPSPALTDSEAASAAVSQGKLAAMSRHAMQHGPRVQWQQNATQQNVSSLRQSQATALAVPPPAAKQLQAVVPSRTTPVPGAANALAADSVSSNASIPVLQSQSIDQQAATQSGYAEAKVEKVKPPVTTFSGGPSKVIVSGMEPPSAPAGVAVGRMVSSLGSTTRWTINSAGGLQRSVDQGASWQDVDVNKSAPPAGAGVSLMKETSRAKAANYNALDKQNQKDAQIIFRAVAANGPDVWAGASGGLLYHSSDAGVHWTRVVPSVSGISLTGDILTVEFIDPQHGRITTSTPEIWTTSDSGESWQKQ